MSISDSKVLWAGFESLFIDRYCPGFWSWEDIDLPYGRVMVMDPDDMPTMLWRADLTTAPALPGVLADLKEIEDRHGVQAGFALSSSWKGDVAAFKKSLPAHGFEVRARFHWMAKDIQAMPEGALKSGFTIEETRDVETFAGVMALGFPQQVADIFIKGARAHLDDDARSYFLARAENDDAVGCGKVCDVNGLAYMSCLAVDPAYRKRGVGRDIVQARLNHIRARGVKYVVTAVNEKNEASLAVQGKAGYAPFETTEYWMRPKG